MILAISFLTQTIILLFFWNRHDLFFNTSQIERILIDSCFEDVRLVELHDWKKEGF